MQFRKEELSGEDWKLLMKQTLAEVKGMSVLHDVLRLFPSTAAMAEYIVARLYANGQPMGCGSDQGS